MRKGCLRIRRLLLLLFFLGASYSECYSQRVMSFGYDQSGNIVYRQFQTLENYLSSSSSKYTAKLYSSPTTGYVRIIVSDENGVVGLPCGVQVHRIASDMNTLVVSQRYENGEHISFDISNCPDGLYAVDIAVDVNNRQITHLPVIKIIKQSK